MLFVVFGRVPLLDSFQWEPKSNPKPAFGVGAGPIEYMLQPRALKNQTKPYMKEVP